MTIEQLQSMDGYTFDEGIAFLVSVKAPLGVVNYLKTTHNRHHLHSEIHKQLRNPNVRRLMNENARFSHENACFSHEIRTKSNEIEPKSHETGTGAKDNVPENDKSGTNKAEDDTDLPPLRGGAATAAGESEIILTKEDVRTHKNTRYEDMPNELCRTLWLKRQDVYRQMQQAHMKMRAVPEGEEHNEERAKWRAEVLRLNEENDQYWEQIDAEIERFNAEQERVENKAENKPAFDVSTYRAYISKAIRKKSLTAAQLAELQHRVDEMIQAGVEMKEETIEKLKAKGIKVG